MVFDPDNPLAVELRQEMAEAYFAACRKMVEALEALKAFDNAAASTTPDRNQLRRRAGLVEQAAERVYFVVIQREAMKLATYEHFFETYEVPAEVKTRMGTRRAK